MSQLQLDLSREAKEKGMRIATEHADRVIDRWSDSAYNFLRDFAKTTTAEFMTEDVREASKGFVPEAPSGRAWGSIVVRAAKAGIIYKVGYRRVKNVKARQTPATLWRRV